MNTQKLMEFMAGGWRNELTRKPEGGDEKKLDLEFCARCDVKTNQGRWWNDEFYCESCVSYYEAKADNMADLEIENAG